MNHEVDKRYLQNSKFNNLCCILDILEQIESLPWYVHHHPDVSHLLDPKHFQCNLEGADLDTI